MLERTLPAPLAGLLVAPLLVATMACGSAPVTGGVITPGADSQVEFGVQMAQRGLWSEALFRFQQAERNDPGDFRVMNNLAVAYEANGDFEQALDYYQRALRVEPGNRELRRNYARFAEFYQSFRPQAGQVGAAAATGTAAVTTAAAGDDDDEPAGAPGPPGPGPGLPEPQTPQPGDEPPPEPYGPEPVPAQQPPPGATGAGTATLQGTAGLA